MLWTDLVGGGRPGRREGKMGHGEDGEERLDRDEQDGGFDG